MKLKLIILLGMIWMHILDDFVLQAMWLSKGKQKSWWDKELENDKFLHNICKNDYKMALFIHSLSWTISIMIIPLLLLPFKEVSSILIYLFLFIANLFIHYILDDLKANKHMVNLINDQCCHLAQIILTCTVFNCMYP